MEKFEYYKEALRNYAVFSGRANRAQYWYFVLFNLIISILLSLLDSAILNSNNSIGMISSFYSLALIVPSFAIATRRLHDIGKSGWWQLIVLLPLVGWIILIVLLARKGVDSENKYGKAVASSAKILPSTKSSK